MLGFLRHHVRCLQHCDTCTCSFHFVNISCVLRFYVKWNIASKTNFVLIWKYEKLVDLRTNISRMFVCSRDNGCPFLSHTRHAASESSLSESWCRHHCHGHHCHCCPCSCCHCRHGGLTSPPPGHQCSIRRPIAWAIGQHGCIQDGSPHCAQCSALWTGNWLLAYVCAASTLMSALVCVFPLVLVRFQRTYSKCAQCCQPSCFGPFFMGLAQPRVTSKRIEMREKWLRMFYLFTFSQWQNQCGWCGGCFAEVSSYCARARVVVCMRVWCFGFHCQGTDSFAECRNNVKFRRQTHCSRVVVLSFVQKVALDRTSWLKPSG